MASDQFFNFLSNIKFSYKDLAGYESDLIREVGGYSDIGVKINIPQMNVKILFPMGGEYQKIHFLGDAKEYIEKVGLDYTDKIFYAVLFAYQYYKYKPDLKVKTEKQRFHSFINSTLKQCSLHQVYPMRMHADPNMDQIYLDSFEIGKFDYAGFKKLLANETQSDYAERFLKEFNLSEDHVGLMCFERELEAVPIVDFVQLCPKYIDYNTFCTLNDYYFEALSAKLNYEFWSDFKNEQNVTRALGMSYFDPYIIRDLGMGKGVQISTYYKINREKRGWVIPMVYPLEKLNIGYQYSIEDINTKSLNLYNALAEETEFSPILNQLINFLAKGNKETSEGNFSEGLLNYWVGLDTILNNTEEANSNMLKNRVAALIRHAKQISHKSAYFKINLSYMLRSKYVHAGENVSDTQAYFLREVAQTILDILTRIHFAALSNAEITYDKWIEDIDQLVLKGKNTDEILSDLLIKIGIIEKPTEVEITNL